MKLLKRFLGIALLFVFIISSLQTQAQDGRPILIDLKNGMFSDGNKKGPLRDFETYFNTDPISAEAFLDYEKARKNQITLNFVGLGVITAGVGAAALSQDEELGGLAIAATGIAFGSFMILMNNLFAESNKDIRKKRLFESYPFYVKDYKNKNELQVHLAYSQYGLGLKVLF